MVPPLAVMDENEKSKRYKKLQSYLSNLLRNNQEIDSKLISNEIWFIKDDVCSSSQDVKSAALEMLEFLLNLNQDVVYLEVIKWFNEKNSDEVTQKCINTYLKKKFINLIIDSPDFVEVLKPWIKQNVNKIIEVIEEICSSELDKKQTADFLVHKLIPLMMSTKIDSETRDVLTEIGLKLTRIVNIFDLDPEDFVKFLKETYTKYIPNIGDLRDQDYTKWYKLWIFLVKFNDKYMHSSMELTNKMLREVEYAFRNNSISQRIRGYDCWKELIDNASLDTNYISGTKQIKLLVTPLKAKFSKQETVITKRFNVFVHLLNKLQQKSTLCLFEFLDFCFGPIGDNQDSTKSGQGKSVPQIWPKSINILLEIIGHSHPKTIGCLATDDPVNFKDPIITSSNFASFYKMIIRSVARCCIFLKDMDIDCTKDQVIRCMWTAVFNLAASDDLNIEDYYKVISYTLEDYLSMCTRDAYFDKVLITIVDSLMMCDKILVNQSVQHLLATLLKILLNITNFPIETFDLIQGAILHLLSQVITVNSKIDMLNKIMMSLMEKKVNSENIIMVNKLWICLCNELISDLTVEQLEEFAKFNEFFYWPAKNQQLLQENEKKLNLQYWVKLYKKITNNSEIKKVNVLLSLEHILDDSHASNIASLMYVMSQAELKFSKDFVHNIMRMICSVSNISNNEVEIENTIVQLLSLYFDNTLKCYGDDDKDEVIKSICATMKHVLFAHKCFKLLDSFCSFLENSSQTICNTYSNYLKEAILEIQKTVTDNKSFESKMLKKISYFLNSDKQQEEKKTFKPPAGRSSRIASLGKKSPRSPIKSSNNNVSALRLFGKDVETMSPLKVKGSLLNNINNTPTKAKSTTKAVAKSKRPEPPSLNDESSSQFVQINTEVKFQPDKLNEHQKEMLKKKREDIPALYQDLSQSQSQDIFNSKSNSNSTSCTQNNKVKVISNVKVNEMLMEENAVDEFISHTSGHSEEIQQAEQPDKDVTFVAQELLEQQKELAEISAQDKLTFSNLSIIEQAQTDDIFVETEPNTPADRADHQKKPKIQNDSNISLDQNIMRRKKLNSELSKLRMDIVGAAEFSSTRKSRLREKQKVDEETSGGKRRSESLVSDSTIRNKVSTDKQKINEESNKKKRSESLTPDLTKIKVSTTAETPNNNFLKKRRKTISEFISVLDNGGNMIREDSNTDKSIKLIVRKVDREDFDSSKETADNSGDGNESVKRKSKVLDSNGKVIRKRKLKLLEGNGENKESSKKKNKSKEKNKEIEHVETGDPEVTNSLERPKNKTKSKTDSVKTKKIAEVQKKIENANKESPDMITFKPKTASSIENTPTNDADKSIDTSDNKPLSTLKKRSRKSGGGRENSQNRKKIVLVDNSLNEDVVQRNNEVGNGTSNIKVINDLKVEIEQMSPNRSPSTPKTHRRITPQPVKENKTKNNIEDDDVIESSQESYGNITLLLNNTKKQKNNNSSNSSTSTMTQEKLDALEASWKQIEKDVAEMDKVSEDVSAKVLKASQETPVMDISLCGDEEDHFEMRKENSTQDTTITQDSTAESITMMDEPAEKTRTTAAELNRSTQDTLTQTQAVNETLPPTQTDYVVGSQDAAASSDGKPAEIYFDLPKKPMLTESEQILCRMDTMSICMDDFTSVQSSDGQTPKKKKTNKDDQQQHRQSMEEIEIRPVTPPMEETASLENILGTPSASNIPSSPVTADTPNRTTEFLSDTVDISPINSQTGLNEGEHASSSPSRDMQISKFINFQEEMDNMDDDIERENGGVIPDTIPDEQYGSIPAPEDLIDLDVENVDDIVASVAEKRTDECSKGNVEEKIIDQDDIEKIIGTDRSDNGNGYDWIVCPSTLNKFNKKSIIKRRLNCKRTVMSPTTGRIKLLMSNLGSKIDSIQQENVNEEDILTFSREIPSPLAEPRTSILKRKFSDSPDIDALSPCAKRKRVNFSDPCLTSKKVFIKDDYPSMEVKRLFDPLPDSKTQEEYLDEIIDIAENNKPNSETESSEPVETEPSLDVVNPLKYHKNRPIYPALVDSKEDLIIILKRVTSPMFATTLMSKLKSNNIKTIGDLAQLSEVEVSRFPFKTPAVANVFKALDNYKKKCAKGRGPSAIMSPGKIPLNGSLGAVQTLDKNLEDEEKKMQISEQETPLHQAAQLDSGRFEITTKAVGHESKPVTVAQETQTDRTPLIDVLRNYNVDEICHGLLEAVESAVFDRNQLIDNCLMPILEKYMTAGLDTETMAFLHMNLIKRMLDKSSSSSSN